MIDFEPMLANPVVLIFGAAGQFGIFLTLLLALALGFARGQAVSIAIIGACDGPTGIYVASKFARRFIAGSLYRGLLVYVTGTDYSASDYESTDH